MKIKLLVFFYLSSLIIFGQSRDKKFNTAFKQSADTNIIYKEVIIKKIATRHLTTRLLKDKIAHLAISLIKPTKKEEGIQLYLAVTDNNLNELYQADLKKRTSTEQLLKILNRDNKVYLIYQDDKKLKGKDNRKKKLFKLVVLDTDNSTEEETNIKFPENIRPYLFFINGSKIWFRGYASVMKKTGGCFLSGKKEELYDVVGIIDATSGELMMHQEKEASSIIRFMGNSDTSEKKVMVLKTQRIELKKSKKVKSVINANPELYTASIEEDKLELNDQLVFNGFPEQSMIESINYNEIGDSTNELLFYGMYYAKWEKFKEKMKENSKSKSSKKKEKVIKTPANIYVRMYTDRELVVDTSVALHDLTDYKEISNKVKKVAKRRIDEMIASEQLLFNFYDAFETEDTFFITFSMNYLDVATVKSDDYYTDDDFVFSKLLNRNIGLVMLCITKDGKMLWNRFIDHKGKAPVGKSERMYDFEFIDDRPSFLYTNDKNAVRVFQLNDKYETKEKTIQLNYKPRKILRKKVIDNYNFESNMFYKDSNQFICVGSFMIDKKLVDYFDDDKDLGKYKTDEEFMKKQKLKAALYNYLLIYTVKEKYIEPKPPVKYVPPAPKQGGKAMPANPTNAVKPATTAQPAAKPNPAVTKPTAPQSSTPNKATTPAKPVNPPKPK